jgi:GcrA cell cycle regulator
MPANAEKRTNQSNSPWTDKIWTRALALWADGLSASKVSQALNQEFRTVFTRNAVIGKLMREGAPKRARQPRDARPKKERRANTFGHFKRGKGNQAPALHLLDAGYDIAIPVEQRKQLVDLRRRDCRWFVGNPGEPNSFFCGAVKQKGSSYCPQHHERAHVIR